MLVRVPYELRGNKVCRSDTGEVVKAHPSREKALAHLRALKANVEEGLPAVLGVLLEGAFDEARHPRDFRGRWREGDHVTLQHGMFGRVPARVTKVTASRVHVSSTDPRVSDTSMTHNQAAVKLEPASPRAFDPVTMLGREGAAARERGASSLATEHADTRDKLRNLPMGQTYGLHGPRGQVGRVERTAKGWEVYGPRESEPKVHETSNSAAGHAMKIQRSAAQSPRHADVAQRNYSHHQEVVAMNARQSQRAAAEAERQLEIRARTASSSRERALAQVELERRRGARMPRPRVREAAPDVLGALLERDFSAEKRRALAKSGAAMSDGSFPIESGGDLDSAIKLARTPAQRAHVKRRAKAIGQSGKLPDGWD